MKGFANPHLVNNEAKLFQPILLLSFGTNGMYIVKKRHFHRLGRGASQVGKNQKRINVAGCRSEINL